MTLSEIVLKLSGPIDPVGETQTDNARFENLIELLACMQELHAKVDKIATDHKDSHEYSVKRAGKACDEYLDWLGVAA